MAGIRLLALRGDTALSRPPPVQLHLNIVFGEVEIGWTAVYHDANRAAVGLAPGADAKKMTERTAHGMPGSMILVVTSVSAFGQHTMAAGMCQGVGFDGRRVCALWHRPRRRISYAIQAVRSPPPVTLGEPEIAGL